MRRKSQVGKGKLRVQQEVYFFEYSAVYKVVHLYSGCTLNSFRSPFPPLPPFSTQPGQKTRSEIWISCDVRPQTENTSWWSCCWSIVDCKQITSKKCLKKKFEKNLYTKTKTRSNHPLLLLTSKRILLSNCIKCAQIIFSCEDAAQQVLMSVCPCVCVWSTWKYAFLHPSTTSRMFQNVSESRHRQTHRQTQPFIV